MRVGVETSDNTIRFYKFDGTKWRTALTKLQSIYGNKLTKVWSYTGIDRKGSVEIFKGEKVIYEQRV